MGEDCLACDLAAGRGPLPGGLIHRTRWWLVEHYAVPRSSAAGLPATPLEVTAADVLAWDRERGEPTLGRGFTPEQEQAIIKRHSESNPGASLAS